MTLASIPLMDRTGRRTLHLYGLGGMFIFSIFITISFLIKASLKCGNVEQLACKCVLRTFENRHGVGNHFYLEKTKYTKQNSVIITHFLANLFIENQTI